MNKWRVAMEQDPHTGDWGAWCPELPGCTTAVETLEECLENIQKAIELYLQPDPIPLNPGAIIIDGILYGSSGLHRLEAFTLGY